MLVSESVAARKACAYTRVHTGKHSCTAAIAAARSIADAQARSGWIRGACGKTCGWLIKRRGVQLRAVMTARSRAASSRHITGTSWHSNGILHDAVSGGAHSPRAAFVLQKNASDLSAKFSHIHFKKKETDADAAQARKASDLSAKFSHVHIHTRTGKRPPALP